MSIVNDQILKKSEKVCGNEVDAKRLKRLCSLVRSNLLVTVGMYASRGMDSRPTTRMIRAIVCGTATGFMRWEISKEVSIVNDEITGSMNRGSAADRFENQNAPPSKKLSIGWLAIPRSAKKLDMKKGIGSSESRIVLPGLQLLARRKVYMRCSSTRAPAISPWERRFWMRPW
jgi:hypothetical protein